MQNSVETGHFPRLGHLPLISAPAEALGHRAGACVRAGVSLCVWGVCLYLCLCVSTRVVLNTSTVDQILSAPFGWEHSLLPYFYITVA